MQVFRFTPRYVLPRFTLLAEAARLRRAFIAMAHR